MKSIGIFEVKKGGTCGIVYVPRKIIGKKVKIFLIEEKDEKSQIDHNVLLIENKIRDLEFQKLSLLTLKSIRNKREEMGIRNR
jgi:hypothetical protein